tara:strand:+ start:2955 stop:4301 length:1347 start_codon:yes stop_codon:yes gene_type:complete
MSIERYSVITKKKIGSFNKTIEVDGDKSISIRAFLIGSISQGISEIRDMLESEDVFSTIKCLRILGVKIKKVRNKRYFVYGKGLGSLSAKKNITLDCGNSGTLTRLLIGILSTNPNIDLKITGDKSLRKRNFSELIYLMSKFGANFKKNKSYLPINIVSSSMPLGINYKSGVSAQLKSAVILAGLNSFGNTEIIEDKKSRDHTENFLASNKKAMKIKKGKKNKILIFGKENIDSIKVKIPGDPSSAAFFVGLCILIKNSQIKVKNVQINSTRIGFYEILKKHGAKIKFVNKRNVNNELVADIVATSSKLRPLKVGKDFYVKTTDEYPLLTIIAGLQKGTSIFRGIEGLKNKESDRVLEMQKILKQIGIRSIWRKNSLYIKGTNKVIKTKKVVKIPDLKDHRIAMSGSILSLATGVKVETKGFETVNTSSPNFLKILSTLGGKFEIKKK